MEPLGSTPFHGKSLVRVLPDLTLGLIVSEPIRITRTRKLVADGNDDLILGVMLDGGAVVGQEGREDVEVRRGEAVICANESTGSSNHQGAVDFMAITIPRAVLVPHLVHPDSAVLSVIPRQVEAMRLLTSYAQMVLSSGVSPDMRALVAGHVHDLAALALGATRDAAHMAAGRGLRAVRLKAIKADIVANLTERDLTLDRVAARHGISPRYVRALFEGEQTSFSDFVRERRLRRAHRLLSSPEFAGRNISSIAFDCGFGDISHFNNAFRRRFGATPSDIRAAARSS
jgi:AraC-like DNA-binding protein